MCKVKTKTYTQEKAKVMYWKNKNVCSSNGILLVKEIKQVTGLVAGCTTEWVQASARWAARVIEVTVHHSGRPLTAGPAAYGRPSHGAPSAAIQESRTCHSAGIKTLLNSTDSHASNCDATLSSDLVKNGSVSSPGYPDPYPAGSHCRYDFQGRGKERVQVVFNDFLLHQPPESHRDCEGVDALVAYVHLEGRMEKIDSFCGDAMPKPLMSNGARLLLEFRGQHSSSHARGFKATYTFTENFGVLGGGGRQLSEWPCGFAFNSSEAASGYVTSPNFPGLYPRDTECHYFFHGAGSQRVRLRFHYFDVEGVQPCEASSASDYVEFSNFMARDRKYSRYCGQLKEFDIESDRKFFRLTFRSNDRLDGTGFNATYFFLDEEESSPAKPRPPSGATGNVVCWTLALVSVFSMLC